MRGQGPDWCLVELSMGLRDISQCPEKAPFESGIKTLFCAKRVFEYGNRDVKPGVKYHN